jgi:hypothetical protein
MAREPVIIGVVGHSMIIKGVIRNLGDPLDLPQGISKDTR